MFTLGTQTQSRSLWRRALNINVQQSLNASFLQWSLPEDADVAQIRASVDQGVLPFVISRTPPVEPEVTRTPINWRFAGM